MVITKISGGLGNQMFQYAIAKSIATYCRDKFLLDISFYTSQNLRNFDLDGLKIKTAIATEQDILNLKGSNNLLFKLQKKAKFFLFKNAYFEEKRFGSFDPTVFQYYKNIYLDGYWQSELYFKDIRNEIIEDFLIKAPLGERATIYLADIQTSRSVSIHIRRGDYVSNTHTNNIHGVCDLKYYQIAINYMISNVEDPKFYIFSDDITWCKIHFDHLDNKIFVENTNNALEDLELMKSCQHNIIANSTFSWWGAWLNQNTKKIVIAPKRWFAEEKMEANSKNIVCESWIRVG